MTPKAKKGSPLSPSVGLKAYSGLVLRVLVPPIVRLKSASEQISIEISRTSGVDQANCSRPSFADLLRPIHIFFPPGLP